MEEASLLLHVQPLSPSQPLLGFGTSLSRNPHGSTQAFRSSSEAGSGLHVRGEAQTSAEVEMNKMTTIRAAALLLGLAVSLLGTLFALS